MKYKKMLVPLDSSRFAECVLDHVKEIATTRAIPEVVLYQVLEPVPAATVVYIGDEGVRESEKRARAAALEYLGQVKSKLGLSSTVTTIVDTGRPAEKILEFIDGKGVDVVVMASHGGTGISKWALGSVVEKVLRHATVPVFLVPAKECR